MKDRPPLKAGDRVNDGPARTRGMVLDVVVHRDPFQPLREDVYVLWLPDLGPAEEPPR
jgi:hypothetical protein